MNPCQCKISVLIHAKIPPDSQNTSAVWRDISLGHNHFYESGSADKMNCPGICADALYLFRKEIKSYAEDWGGGDEMKQCSLGGTARQRIFTVLVISLHASQSHETNLENHRSKADELIGDDRRAVRCHRFSFMLSPQLRRIPRRPRGRPRSQSLSDRGSPSSCAARRCVYT